MKKHIILAVVAALATLTACSNDEEEPKVPGAEVTFSINGPVTRATTNVTSNVTTFNNDDEVGIFSKGLYIDLTGEIFTVNGGNLDDTNNTNPRFNANKSANFYAFYPAKGIASGTTITKDANSVKVTVSEDQSSTAAFDKNDFMVAICENKTSTAPNIEFKFNHKLSLIKVDVSSFEENVTINAVQIEGVQTSTTWNYTANSLTPSGETKTVKMGNPSTEKTTEFWAIIPAQSSLNVTFQLTTSDNKLYTYKLTSGTFDEGKIYSYKMNRDLTSMSATVKMENEWTSGVSEDNAITGREIRELISSTEGTISSTTSFPGANWESVNVGWGKANTSASVALSDDNAYAKLTVSNINNTSYPWYWNSITFKTKENLGNISGIYELTIVGKADASNNGAETLKLFVLAPALKGQSFANGSSNKFTNPLFAMSDAGGTTTAPSTTGKPAALGTGDTTLKYRVDLTKVHASSEYSQATDADTFSKGIVIAMANTTVNQVFYVKSITLKEVE